MASPRRECRDCKKALVAIRLMDTGHADRHHDLEYASAESERGFFFGRYPVAGRVAAMVCPACGRISLFAEPRD